MPIIATNSHPTPTANEPEVIAKVHTEAAKPDRLVLTISLPSGKAGAGTEMMSIGFTFPFGISFATADNAGPNNVKPKIPIAVVKPIMKDFLFDLGFFLELLLKS